MKVDPNWIIRWARRLCLSALIGAAWPADLKAADTPSALKEFDALGIARVKDSGRANSIRQRAISFIWKSANLPNTLPNDVASIVEPPPMDVPSDNVLRVQRLTQRMEHGIETHAYFFQAEKQANCLLIYHTGHGELRTAQVRNDFLGPVLDGGCDLILASMPLMHENPRPVVSTRFGPLLLRDHNALALLASQRFNPLKLFMEPVLAALNHAFRVRGSYRAVFMAGLSGGGWTTTLYAALDPRITTSFPVAGSLPLSLRSFLEHQIGDWEQVGSGIYDIANYLDLYLLATFPKRTQIQLLTVNDPCCFGSRLHELYEGKLAQMAKRWGGEFRVSLDETSIVHDVTRQHISTILHSMGQTLKIEFPASAMDRCAAWKDRMVDLDVPFEHFDGHAYFVRRAFRALSNNERDSQRSSAILCENGVALGPPHAKHLDVQKVGRGFYSHYHDALLFSSSDNSDPNVNGRRYAVVPPPRGKH